MITTEKVKKATERLETLKKLTLEKYLDEIDDLNSDILIYDVMFHHLVKSDFDEEYEFSALKNADNNEKKEVKSFLPKYMHLCFYDGSVDYWSDSTEIKQNSDYDLVAAKVLDNYDFLITLALDGGEEALEELDKLKDKEYYVDSSVVEYLRNTFFNDDVLIKTILNMTAKNNLFKVFTDEQKEVLFRYPEGVLYFYDNESVKLVNPLFLAKELCSRNDVILDGNMEKVALNVTEQLRQISKEEFDSLVFDLSDDYLSNMANTMYRGSFSDLPVVNDDGSYSDKIWLKEKNDKKIN